MMKAIHINTKDNVAVAIQPISAGGAITVNDEAIVAREIATGGRVHTHNLKTAPESHLAYEHQSSDSAA